MNTDVAIAFRSYLAPLTSARAFRIVLICAFGWVSLIVLFKLIGFVSRNDLDGIRAFAIVPGIPIAAALMSEMALRDGITHRTLLYPLLGPVPRRTLAVVRTITTGLVLAAVTASIIFVLHMLRGRAWLDLPQELLGIILGAVAYTSLFNVIHLWSRRGLITSLAFFGIFDYSIGMVPFNLRQIAPSHHLRNLGDLHDALQLPIALELSETSVLQSAIYLILLAVASTSLGAVLFSRKNLGELC